MQLFLDWPLAIWVVLCESGPYLLLGFFIAGLLKVLVPEDKVFKHLGSNSMRSVGIASCCGIPIPLCSCSVVPTAIALRRSGASKGATTSFLISTPETGVDSIGITWALMDPIMTVMRPVSALFTALAAGGLVNFLERRGWVDEPPTELEPEACDCEESCEPERTAGKRTPREVIRVAAGYAFGPLMADLAPSFVFGFVLSALIMILLPENLIGEYLPGGWVSMFAMLVVGIPIYICATASTPVAAALVAKGLDPGAALVFLLAGPATNLATLHAVRSFLGKRVLISYLAAIAVLSLLMGWFVNGIYSTFSIAPFAADPTVESLGWISMLGGLVLGMLLFKHALALDLTARYAANLRRWLEPLGIEPSSARLRALVLVVVLGSWLGSGLTVLNAGETGFLLRFGAVVETYEKPGLQVHWPVPIDRVDVVRTEEIRGIELGTDTLPTGDAGRTTTETRVSGSEVMTGDENILRISFAVHSRVANAYQFRYEVEDPEPLLRGLAESSLRMMAAHRTANEMLVATRPELEAEVTQRLQVELDAVGAGVDVVSVNLLDIHAPAAVHEAFRDVASSLEDKERHVREGEKYEIEKVASARATAYASEQLAMSEKVAKTDGARGNIAAFVALKEVMPPSDSVNRFRLRMEAAERSLRGANLVLVLDDDVDVVLTTGATGMRAATLNPLRP